MDSLKQPFAFSENICAEENDTATGMSSRGPLWFDLEDTGLNSIKRVLDFEPASSQLKSAGKKANRTKRTGHAKNDTKE